MRITRATLVIAMFAWIGLTPKVAAQPAKIKVSYDVELSTLGSLLDNTHCPGAGTDVLTGTLVGMEPADPTDDNEYVGTLTRSTRITTCDSRRTAAGLDVVCSMSFTGDGFADVSLTVYFDGRGGWLQYLTDRTQWAHLLPPAPVGPVNSVVNGTCDPAEMAQLQNDYPGGQTAGSPSGQPIEVIAMPTSGFPKTIPAKPPESIWTLKVLARRP
jgi:hypothetical protein